MTHIFLDTNILLHYIDFNQIKWEEIIKNSDYTVVIPTTVISELDTKKRENTRVGSTAKKVLSRIKAARKDKDSKLLVAQSVPNDEFFKLNGLDYREKDDHILAIVKMFKDENIDSKVLICTDDTGLFLKCERFNIEVLELNEELYGLKSEPSTTDRELSQLKRENFELKNQQAILEICFDSKELYYKSCIDKGIDLNPLTYWQNQMREIKRRFPKLTYKEKKYEGSILDIMQKWNDILPIQVDNYNKELDEYFKKMDDISMDLIGEWRQNIFSINLSFLISSVGTLPAKNIDLLLLFPEGFVIKDKTLIERVRLPDAPIKPNNSNIFTGPSTLDKRIIDSFKEKSISNSMIKEISHVKVEGKGIFTSVHLKLGDIKHYMNQTNSDVVVQFHNFEEMKSFKILYEITAENIPKKVEGELSVIITSDQNDEK